MSSHNKKLLYSHRRENFMEVVDQGEYRSLYFQNSVVQSRVSLQEPGRLVLRYTQYMMAASLLAHPQPTRALLVGVGAGSLLHFFQRYLPECRIDAVDYSDHVLEIARRFFALPETDNIAVHCEDGLQYLARLGKERQFDLILLDAFNDSGMAKNIYSHEFFKLAGERLSEKGILCCNLWSGNHQVYSGVKKAIVKHSESSLFIPVRRRENVVALLFRSDLPWKMICPPAHDLEILSREYDIDFSEVSAAAQKSNMRLGEKLRYWFS